MIKRRRHKDKASANDNSASLKKGNVSSFVPIIFIATMMVCLSFSFAVPAIIGGFFATITVINKVGPKTLIGAILIFVMLQTAVASPVEDNDPEFEVDRVAAAILSVWLVAAVVMVTLMGGRRELERPDLTTEDSTTATGIDEELGYQGSACDVDRQNKRARLGEDGAIAEEGSDSGLSEFQCEFCSYASTRGEDSNSHPHKKLWDDITKKSGTTVEESVAEVHCPNCKAKAFQCRHCKFRKFEDDPKAIDQKKKAKRSMHGLVRHHALKQHKNKFGSPAKDDAWSTGGDSFPAAGSFGGPAVDGSKLMDVFQEEGGPGEPMDCDCNSAPMGCDETSRCSSQGPAFGGPDLMSTFDDSDESDEEPDDDVDEVNKGEDIFMTLLQSHLWAGLLEEQDEADEYVATFQNINMNNYDPGREEEDLDYCDSTPPPFRKYDSGKYDIDDFLMLDFRTETEKKKYKEGREHKSQNQLYFYQKYSRRREVEEAEAKRTTQEVTGSELNDDRTKALLKAAGGFQGLVGRSFAADRDNEEATANPEETDLGYRLFDLVVQMKDSVCERFCRYNEAWWKYYDVASSFKAKDKSPVPMNTEDLRRYFMVGPNSILSNFPAPRVYEKAKHACVNLKEVFLIYAGHGARFSFCQGDGKENSEGLNGTKAMKDLVDEVNKRMEEADVDKKMRKQTKIGWLIFWSDSFLNSFIKQKDNSVWMLTVTICPPENMKTSGRYTYILAIGKSDADHSEVIDHYLEEADKLMKGFDCYFGATNKIERVALGLLCWSADRPEQQSITHTRKEGHYGKVTGWAVNVSQEFLPACKRCYKSLIKSMIGVNEDEVQEANGSQCNKCCNWSFKTNPVQSRSGESVNLQNTDTPGKQYPRTYPDNAPEKMPEERRAGMNCLPPVKLSMNFVVQAIRCGYYGVRLGNWTKPNIEEYFKTCNIKTSTAHAVYEIAVKHKSEQSDECPTHESLVANASEAVPNFLTTVDCWERFRFPNLPMHGLAHGMIPDVMEIVHSVFKKYGKLAAFIKFANATLTDVASFRLDYCKLKILPKAAWVGENSMGYMRLMSYLYGMFLLNNSLGKSEEAKITEDVLKCFVNSFQAYVSLLMTKRAVDPAVLERHMKLFMSAAHYLHKCHGKLNMKKNGESGPGKKSNSGKKEPRFVDTRSVSTLRKIAEKLGMKNIAGDTTKDVLIKRLLKPKLKDLFAEISKLIEKDPEKAAGLEPRLKGVKKKDVLIQLVHEAFWSGDDDADDDDETPDEWCGIEKAENMCWARGNWLSFMANMAEQVEYLGQLHLIW